MHARLHLDAAIQAFGVLLRREGKRASRLRLLKLLYMAARESIRRHGRPIAGGKLVAMQHGPVNSPIYDLINGEHVAEARWSQYFRNDGRDIVLEYEPDVGKLSRQDVELLNEIVDANSNLDDWSVANKTHAFPEWRKNYPDPFANTSRPIQLEELIEAVDRTMDSQSIIQEIKDSEAFDVFFASLKQ